MQTYFRCVEGEEEEAAKVARNSCKKKVWEMWYEARTQAAIDYHARILGRKLPKEEARSVMLTRDQYLQVNGK